jgi:GMP reductase
MNKFDFNDILIKPAKETNIDSRKSISPYHGCFLPLITAPMDTVVNEKNKLNYAWLDILTCLPRGEKNDIGFESYSLKEIDFMLNVSNDLREDGMYLIDIANGHMSKLIEVTKAIKTKFPKITLMVGNVANPETYVELSEAGADFIRVGIGNGGGCSTTVHTGIGFPMGSLIRECFEASCKMNKAAKIVADGGMQNYSDIIKALALGADYVMVGSLFNKAIDSCGDNFLWGKIKVSQKIAEWIYTYQDTNKHKYRIPIYKNFRGMSTKEVQLKWGKTELTSSEGVTRMRKVEYTLEQWVENFEDYLRSSMSYSNARTLNEFIGFPEILNITENAYNRYKK